MKLKERIHRFLHDEKLKRKLYVIIFESDTPAGKLFDVILIACILVSVLLVIIESLKGLPTYLTTPFVIMEFLFTGFFTLENLTSIYCLPPPRIYWPRCLFTSVCSFRAPAIYSSSVPSA